MADSSPLYTETPMEEHTERHVLYERMAEQYIQLLNPGKALDNALDAIKWKRDSYKAHWLMGRSFMSLTMYEEGIQAFSAALELCCLEEKRQEILIEVLVQHCSRRDRGRLDIIKNISSATWASVAYDLTKVKLFSEAHTAFLQLMKVIPYQSNVRVNLRPLCDVDTVSKEVWILDLIKCLLRHGSDYNTMTSHSGDTYVHVVVRMTLVTGEIGLLQYVLESTLRQGELNELLDCLGNTALHLAAQYPKCSPFIRLDVMKLLAEAGVDETLKNSEGKTAVDYVSRSENHVLQCYKDYRAVCAKMLAEKADDIENSKEGDLEQETSADHTNVIEEQTEYGTNNNTKPLANSLITDEVPDDCSFENVDQLQGSGRIKEGDDDQLMLSPMQVGHGQTESQSQGRSEDFIVDSHLQVKPVPNKSEHDEEIHHVDDNALKQSQKRSWPPDYQSCTSDESKSKVKAGVEIVHDGDTTVQPVEQEQTDIDDEENVSENLGINDDDLMPEVKPHIITRHPAGSIEEQLKKNVIGMDDEDHVSQNHARNEDGMSEVQTQPFKQHSVENDQCSEMLSGDEYAMWTEHTITKSTKMNDPNGDKDWDFFPHVQSLFSSDTLIENKNFENSENGPMTTGLETEDNFDRHSYSPAPELHQMRMTMKNKSDDNDQKINKIDVISNLKQDGVPKTKFSVSISGELYENEVLTWEVGPVLLEDIIIKKFDKEGCEQTHDRKSQQAILPKTYKVCDMEANLMPNTPNSENYDETHMAREVCTQTTTTHDRLHQIEHVKNKLERSKDSQSDNLKHIHKEVKELFNEGKSWLVDLRQKKKGFEILGRCLQKACLLSTDGYANDSITLICQHLDDTVDQDFCICLVHIPENYLNRILYLLLDDKKWTCALSIIKSHRKRHDSKTALVETVNVLRLESVILDSKFRKSTKRLEHLIEDLLKIGVSLPEEGKGCIQACIRSGHYGIIPLLLSRGAHPKHVTLSIGDTPIHASTSIALETGNIEILEILLKKYKEDPRKNSHCDPCETNNNGDGLLHIVLRRPDGTMSRKVIDILLHHVPIRMCCQLKY
ncbi:uncharacterized protein [Argopecten irradians]|uniref:uncharacterized protein n=1 Tax=Argopecten irradians TaxID=31199 RepID=UPI0037222EC8